MLSEAEFLVLNIFFKADSGFLKLSEASEQPIMPINKTGNLLSQRKLAKLTGLSLGNINACLKDLDARGFLHKNAITLAGKEAMRPYKVDNAIIMAAGMSTRFAPLSYERPKGTLIVKGEVLIERTIRQLQEVGITDITIVVGYMKEHFLYLEDRFNVRIVINEWFSERNNHSSLYLVRDRLANTYICSADNYFTVNPFESHVYRGYYSAVYAQGDTCEYCLTVGSHQRITKVTVGDANTWIMLGHAYYDRTFSETFAKILEQTFGLSETKPKLWEDIYAENLCCLDLRIRRWESGIIYEFDSLDDVRSFDPDFLTNIDSDIFNNICTILSCERKNITDIAPIEEGLSNFSFYFKVNVENNTDSCEAKLHEHCMSFEAHDSHASPVAFKPLAPLTGEYVYRHPGAATVGLIKRDVEAQVNAIGHKLGLDRSFVYLDPQTGWKISKFIHTSEKFNYYNSKHVSAAMAMIHKLHDSGVVVSSEFDLREETNKIKLKLGKSSHLGFSDFEELDARAERIYNLANKYGARKVISHNDFYDPNILVTGEQLSLIDWEYSGMSDYASDLGTFICCSEYSYEQAVEALEQYFGRSLTDVELAHCVAYVSLSGYYWFVWALNKEAANESVGEYLHLWYRFAKEYGRRAEDLFTKLLS
ncbi:MAG: NTP transferase domain-containing protein [Coriobacteriales bacterium]|nr:NTP transferase domain-containing protein [Coriobacteriales bacterium]